MIRGQTINVAINPLGAKQLIDAETFVPAHLDLRNGVRTDAGHYKGRPGYSQAWALGVAQPIPLLLPKKRTVTSGLGFAVTQNGLIYELLPAQAVQLYNGPTLNGTFRPTWCEFDGIPHLFSGQAPIRIRVDQDVTQHNVELVPGSPPPGKYCGVLADHIITSGYDVTAGTEFRWSDPGSADIWPAQNISNVTGHGEEIRYMTVADTSLVFFKTASIEVWQHVGGIDVFDRAGIVTIMDKFSRNRGIASWSIVGPIMGAWFFYCDGDFYTMSGLQAQPISGTYKRELGLLPSVEQMYGYHFAKEHLIRWFEPVSARCFTYDYATQIFTEDNAWLNGEWARLPVYSYMESGATAYVGDYDPTGTIYQWSDAVQADNGNDVRVYRKFRVPLSKNGHRCRLNRMRLRFKRGSGAIGSAPDVNVRWAFDGTEFTNYQSINLGTSTVTVAEEGNYDPYVDVLSPAGNRVLGIGREVLVELWQTSQVQHLLTHCNLTVQELGS